MSARLGLFIEMSALLTGFARVQLLGTGKAGEYLRTLDEVPPAGVADELLTAFRALPAQGDPEAAVAAGILGEEKLGPVARNVILLWYCGTWSALPDYWRSAYGASPRDINHVVSGQAYQAGLQWVVAGAHPEGARQQGYGAWAVPPAGAPVAAGPEART
jgi:hypothetical protein